MGRERCWLLALLGLVTGTLLTFPGLCLGAEKVALSNGLTVVFEASAASATTSIQVLIRGGKRAEPEDRRGLSFLTTRLAVEIPDSDKAQELTGLASTFSVSSRGDYSLINVECLTSGLDPTLRILGQIITSPLFSGLRIDSIKKYMAHQAFVEQDDIVVVGHQAALSRFFGNGAYGGSSYGDEKSLRAIQNRDVSAFYKRAFTVPNLVVSVCSDMDKEALLALLDRAFGSLPGGEALSLPPVSFLPLDRGEVVIEKESKQSLVSLAYPLTRLEPRRYALNEVLRSFLGKGSGSRLWPLRSEKKLAYSVDCRVTQMLEAGMLEAYLQTDPAKKDEALQALRETLAEVREKGLTADELKAAKAVTKTGFLRDNELKQARAATLGAFEILGLGYEYFSRFPAEIDSLDLEEVNAYVKEVLDPEKALLVVVGPAMSK